ncbi:unnamed protein product [Phytophthora fragariaefolia]|uniref:Unnamed protein product n=1 Tax=Phytophthora fragariaefolia TaxID=1490495 RepID=A0A9W6UEE6_9STRA|nr:unnamed protein product [Phytophthora fragariaefolia]
MWGSSVELIEDGFTLEKVSNKLDAIFGTKSKSEIWSLASGNAVNHVNAAPPNPKGPVLGKRKAVAGSERDLHYNIGSMKCHYCGGVRNNMNNVGPHKMINCPKLYEPTPKTRGNGKGKTNTKVRREVPLDECLTRVVAVDSCNAEQGASPATADGYTNPPPSNFEVPLTPGKGTLPFSDEDEPMDTVVNAVNADATGKAQAARKEPDGDVDMEEQPDKDSNQGIAETTKTFAGILTELEKKVRSFYPYLLEVEMYLTTNSWVLDSGCGHGLTSEMVQFVRKEPNTQYMFTFAQSSKHSNTYTDNDGKIRQHKTRHSIDMSIQNKCIFCPIKVILFIKISQSPRINFEWFCHGFTSQKPQTAKKSTEALEQTRAEFALDFWKTHAAYGPEGMYNVDETAINFDMPPARMGAGRGRRDAAMIANTSKHTGCMTAVLTIRADVPGRTLLHRPRNAWMDAVTWRFYVEMLLKYEVDGPAVLLLDNFECHVSEEGQRVVAEVANGTVVPLPTNSTAACQPLDVGVMGPLKARLRSNWSGITGGSAKEKRLRAVRATIAAWDAIPYSTVIRSFKAAIPQYPEISI